MNEEEVKRARTDLYYWQYPGRDGAGTNFTSVLINLLQKSDPGNVERIRKGFPELVSVWEEWRDSASEEECFKNWGLR